MPDALTRRHKLRVWQACVYTATVYGLDACGLTPFGVKRLTAQIARQVRLIVRDPVYMTGHSHHQALKNQLLKEAGGPNPDAFKRGSGSAAWHSVLNTLTEAPSTQLIELPNSDNLGAPCPECGIYFASRASMLGHMSKKHADQQARPVNQAHRVFDKHKGAQGGLPQCSHCGVKLCDFSSLRKHTNERGCRALFPPQPLHDKTAETDPRSPSHQALRTRSLFSPPSVPNAPAPDLTSVSNSGIPCQHPPSGLLPCHILTGPPSGDCLNNMLKMLPSTCRTANDFSTLPMDC